MTRQSLRRVGWIVFVLVCANYVGRLLFGAPIFLQTICRIGSPSASLALVTYKTLNIPTPLDPGGRFWTSGAVVYEEWWGWKKREWLVDSILGYKMDTFGLEMCSQLSVRDGIAALFATLPPGAIASRIGTGEFVSSDIAEWGPPSILGQHGRIERWVTTGTEIRDGQLLGYQVAPAWFEQYFDQCYSRSGERRDLPFLAQIYWENDACKPVASRTVTSDDLGATWRLHSCELLPAAKEKFGDDVQLAGCDTGLDLEQWRKAKYAKPRD